LLLSLFLKAYRCIPLIHSVIISSVIAVLDEEINAVRIAETAIDCDIGCVLLDNKLPPATYMFDKGEGSESNLSEEGILRLQVDVQPVFDLQET
jgi:hypothetical protein